MDRETYYYAIYCLMPNYGSDGECGDGSFAARYNERRALAIFVRNGAGDNARLLFERADQEIGVIRVADKPELTQTSSGMLLYTYIESGNFSLQGMDANQAWMTIRDIARQLDIPVEIDFEWRDKDGVEDVATRGRKARLSHSPKQ